MPKTKIREHIIDTALVVQQSIKLGLGINLAPDANINSVERVDLVPKVTTDPNGKINLNSTEIPPFNSPTDIFVVVGKSTYRVRFEAISSL